MKAAKDEEERATAQSYVQFFERRKNDVLSNKGGANLGYGMLDLAYRDLDRLSTWFANPSNPENVFGENTAALEEAFKDSFDRFKEMLLEAEEN